MSARPWLVVSALAVVLLAACGGGGGSATSTATTPTQTRATSSPAASPTAGTPAPGTQTPGGQITLTISSISPNPAKVGDQLTITFKTQPGNVIGFQITDSQGSTVAQNLVTAGSDGMATFTQTISGPTGTWDVQGAAAASVNDLLRLQAAPTAGPETADATFQVQ